MSPSYKLYYFPLPGRGEVVRMLFNYGGIEFTEQQFSFEEWGKEWKAKMTEAAFGQVPVLEVDGKMLSQSGAMERYIAKKVGVYPADDWEAAKVEEAVGLVQDMFNTMLFSTTAKMTPEEKLAARKDMAAGPLKARLDCLVKLLSRSGGDFCVGSTLTYADFALFGALCMLTSGFLDGVPTDALEPYPELKAFHGRFAALPAIAKMYESATGLHASCKALPAAT
uniref:Glutathione transferase n=1 Tax=Chlamydomonas euryale TaxID=1486919 RepID=A0A6U2GVG4_9CHLO|mmetsp:Transcript_36213/g.106944  ORF Transcript_36213/g.106944 Transcript_36213/m.106944 type:complete len:224 (+) Transcript_36213:54-725(+)